MDEESAIDRGTGAGPSLSRWSAPQSAVGHAVGLVLALAWLVGGTALGFRLILTVGFAWHGDTAPPDGPEPWVGWLWLALLGPFVGVCCWFVRYVGTESSRYHRERFAWVSTVVIAALWAGGVLYLFGY